MSETVKRLSWAGSPAFALLYVLCAGAAGALGHLYGVAVLLGLAVLAIGTRAERTYAELADLKAELAVLRAERAAAPLPGRDGAPDQG